MLFFGTILYKNVAKSGFFLYLCTLFRFCDDV